jgi:hypothetical protein
MSGRGDGSLISHGERLGRAIKWLDHQKRDDHAVVEEACRRFDLSPADEEFLQKMWRERAASRPGDRPK